MKTLSTSYIEPGPRSYPLNLSALGILLTITVVAAAVGTIASIAAPEFYLGLNRPTWAPPSSVFAPVWTVLYVLMAIAAWTVVRIQGWKQSMSGIVLYCAQLVANALWTWLFFRWHTGVGAFVDIMILWVLIVSTIAMFWKAHWVAGALLLPYLAWVSFATCLTWAVWQANQGML
ncbi:MAG: TspO/MBR family protein [Gemmatimonadaceae bacterium]